MKNNIFECIHIFLHLLHHVFNVKGTVDKGIVEVTNSFGVPHKEYEDTVSNTVHTTFFLCDRLCH